MVKKRIQAEQDVFRQSEADAKKEQGSSKLSLRKIIKFGSKNYWMIASIALVIILFALLVNKSITTVSGKSITTVSGEKAAQSLVDFAKSQGVEITVKEISSEGGMYKVLIEIQGQEAPFYVTRDGKFFTSSLVPLKKEETEDNGNTQTNTEIPKTDKPKVELFIMSYCPYGTQMQKAILPVASLLGDKIDFKVRWVSYIMHGKKEADENTVQYCIQKEQGAKYLDYIKCFLAYANSTRCLKNASINTALLNSCITKTDSEYKITETVNAGTSQYPRYAIDAEDNTEY